MRVILWLVNCGQAKRGGNYNCGGNRSTRACTHAQTHKPFHTRLYARTNSQTVPHAPVRTHKLTNRSTRACTHAQTHKPFHTRLYARTNSQTVPHAPVRTHKLTNLRTRTGGRSLSLRLQALIKYHRPPVFGAGNQNIKGSKHWP